MPTGEAKARIGAEHRQAVLDHMIREADMDGVVTISGFEVGRAVGISQATASHHLRALVCDGLLTAVGRTDGIRGRSVLIFRLNEDVMA